MTKDEIIQMAREAGLSDFGGCTEQNIERFAALVSAAEREAMVAEAAKMGLAMKNEDPFEDYVREIANDRARKQSES